MGYQSSVSNSSNPNLLISEIWVYANFVPTHRHLEGGTRAGFLPPSGIWREVGLLLDETP